MQVNKKCVEPYKSTVIAKRRTNGQLNPLYSRHYIFLYCATCRSVFDVNAAQPRAGVDPQGHGLPNGDIFYSRNCAKKLPKLESQ